LEVAFSNSAQQAAVWQKKGTLWGAFELHRVVLSCPTACSSERVPGM
jgi:hypothetical protein